MSSPMVRSLGHVVAMLATVALMLVIAVGGTVAGNGNNGTIKIHESTDPNVETPSNDPKVCRFNVEGFGFDLGVVGTIVFSVQGGDAPTGSDAGPIDVSDGAVVDGYFESEYVTLEPGHYKATMYGKSTKAGQLGEVKAKSKVIKVTSCGGGEGGEDVPGG